MWYKPCNDRILQFLMKADTYSAYLFKIKEGIYWGGSDGSRVKSKFSALVEDLNLVLSTYLHPAHLYKRAQTQT